MLVIPEYIREEVVTVLAVNFNSFFNQLALEVWIQLYTFTVLYSPFFNNNELVFLAYVSTYFKESMKYQQHISSTGKSAYK